MQLSAALFVALFSLLSLQVLGHPHRTIRPRPGSPHRGSGLGGGGIFPFPSQTKTKPLASASPASASAINSPTSSPQPVASDTPIQPSLSSAFLSLHTQFRQQYAAKPLNWSETLASAAQQWASNCQWAHSTMPFGENIAAGTGNFTVKSAFQMWASEAPQYNTTDPIPSHFTQLVWKETTQVGCAVANCTGLFGGSSPTAYFVCEYEPPGNVVGNFSNNVQ